MQVDEACVKKQCTQQGIPRNNHQAAPQGDENQGPMNAQQNKPVAGEEECMPLTEDELQRVLKMDSSMVFNSVDLLLLVVHCSISP